MSTTAARNHARRVYSARTAEDKLNEMAKAIEQLANALDQIEKHAKRAEALAAHAANR